MSRWEGEKYPFIRGVSARIQDIIYLATIQRNITPVSEETLATLDQYMSPEIKKFRDNAGKYSIELEDPYNEELHRIRTIAITLYNIEAIPSPRTAMSKLKFQKIMNDHKSESVAQNIDYRNTMAYYLEARRSLTKRIQEKPDSVSNPYHALHFLLDVGISLLAPYISKKEYDMWKRSCELVEKSDDTVDDPDAASKSQMNKMVLQSKVMHRQGFQFGYRDVDKMGYQPEGEDVVEKYKEIEGV